MADKCHSTHLAKPNNAPHRCRTRSWATITARILSSPPAGDTGQRWTIFNDTGEMLGNPSLPERFVISEVGDDYVLGVWEDELEIEHVRMYELIKP